MRSLRPFAALGALLALPAAAGAQILQPPASQPASEVAIPRHSFGLDVTVGQPLGEFSTFINEGYGVGGHYLLRIDRRGILGLRVQGGFLTYGRENNRVCLSTTVGCRIVVDVSTTNNIISGGVGPQLQLPTGPVRPYVAATGGFSYFFTRSSVEGSNEDFDFASTTNQDDGTLAWTGMGGFLIPLRSGREPIMLDLGVRYNGNGRAEYLRRGSIRDLPDGNIEVTPIRSETNLVSYHIGVTVGVGARR